MSKDKLYQKELFERLTRSLDLKKEKQLFSQLFKQPIFWIVEQKDSKRLYPLNGASGCANKKTKLCGSCIQRAIKAVRRSKRVEQFVCPGRSFGLCLPLVQGDALYGFLILCHLESCPSYKTMRLFEALNSKILEKVQKELELSKLYKTIRPRAVALSTIHTIRRLISSTLNLDELLPRIARLSLQVLRARQCVISLIEEKGRHLVPKAVIDISKKHSRPSVPARLKRIEKKVLRNGNIILKRSLLSVPLIDEEPVGVITVLHKMGNKPFDNFDQEILTALSEQAVGAINNAQLYREQENILLGTVKSLTTLLKVKSDYPYTHSKMFMNIVLGIANKLRLSEEQLRNLKFAAMLHDAGEIGIPEQILKKPAHLTGKEFELVKEHPKKSAQILSPLQRLKPAIAIILHHHEKFDGSGYPGKLKGKAIPLGARIMAVADSFEAMISRRPYRKTTSIAKAVKEIKRYSAKQFDPQVIEAFLKLVKTKGFKRTFRHGPRRSKKNM
jgi:HD-GYP domain-containing protein (c-di-GMP phosphodiesterase class II)